MHGDTDAEAVLLALAKIQAGSALPEVMSASGVIIALCAASLLRAQETGAVRDEAGEADTAAALMSYTGTVGRRRLLAHMRRNGVLHQDALFYKLMTPGSAPALKQIIRFTAERNGRTSEEVLGQGQRPEAVMARFEAGWIAVRAFGFPLANVAEALNRNHTTVLSGINKIDIMIRRSPLRLDGLLESADLIDAESAERYGALFIKKRGAEAPPKTDQ